MKQYPLHHEDARPMFATVETEWLDQLMDGQKMLQGLTISRENIKLISESLNKARTKHPKFCDCITRCKSKTIAESYECQRKNLCELEVSEGKVSAEVILLEEVSEMITQVVSGEKMKAKEEAADCIAVLVRIMEELDK